MTAADASTSRAPAEQVLTASSVDEATRQKLPAQGVLQARFVWSGDRYVHRIEAGTASPKPIMQTLLRDATLDWPLDPPMQQLSIETPGEQSVALGVGSAGTSHWSLSIEAIPGATPALRYDLACRCRTAPSRLGSAFELLPEGARFAIESQTATVAGDATGGTLQIVPEPTVGPVLWETSEQGRVLLITANLGETPGSGTFRWGFRVVWHPAQDND